MLGVLWLIITLDGENVIDCEPILGHLHRVNVDVAGAAQYRMKCANMVADIHCWSATGKNCSSDWKIRTALEQAAEVGWKQYAVCRYK
ncbi:hypothetical protein LOK49_LG14G00744 [Camellia lanceoleosa]|uniref:Uncharacterized protein n=1 Tax=Camellia lanceoleosa TaxID=1840588 RepID=A0ACC0FDG5_9ERIC|nr:hypothetical protein LOK49_LG14G00744 [Camellia lanceoleosa]